MFEKLCIIEVMIIFWTRVCFFNLTLRNSYDVAKVLKNEIFYFLLSFWNDLKLYY